MDPHQPPAPKPNDVGKSRKPLHERGDPSWKTYSDQWRENHGTLLMSFAAVIVLTGVAVLLFQQNRFRKPAFPTSQVIANSSGASESNAFSMPDSSDGDGINAPAFRLRIVGATVEDEPNGGGLIRIAVYSTDEQFNQPEFAIWKHSIAIEPGTDPECLVPVDTLPTAFAIAAFQDVNENGQLDRNLLGVPSERYGFSNAARGKIGPPDFDDAVMDRPEPESELELEIW